MKIYSLSIKDETGNEVYKLDNLTMIAGSAYDKEEGTIVNFCNSSGDFEEIMATAKGLHEFALHIGKSAIANFVKEQMKKRNDQEDE